MRCSRKERPHALHSRQPSMARWPSLLQMQPRRRAIWPHHATRWVNARVRDLMYWERCSSIRALFVSLSPYPISPHPANTLTPLIVLSLLTTAWRRTYLSSLFNVRCLDQPTYSIWFSIPLSVLLSYLSGILRHIASNRFFFSVPNQLHASFLTYCSCIWRSSRRTWAWPTATWRRHWWTSRTTSPSGTITLQ